MPKERVGKYIAKHRLLFGCLSFLLAAGISGGIFVLRGRLKQLINYGYAGVFLLSAIGHGTVLLPMPTFLTAFIGGGFYNPIVVGLVAGFGAAIGELTGYLAGLGGHAIVRDRQTFIRIQGWMRRYGLVGLFALAAFPNPVFDMAGIVAGVLRLPIAHFLLAVFLGKSFMFVILSFLGAGSIGLLQQFW